VTDFIRLADERTPPISAYNNNNKCLIIGNFLGRRKKIPGIQITF